MLSASHRMSNLILPLRRSHYLDAEFFCVIELFIRNQTPPYSYLLEGLSFKLSGTLRNT